MKLNEIAQQDPMAVIHDDVVDGVMSGVLEWHYEVDGTISCNGNCRLSYKKLHMLPVKFEKIRGDFTIDHNFLTSFDGFPKSVGNDLNFYDNDITSLIGISDIVKYVGRMFAFDGDKIKTGGLGLLLIKGLTKGHIFPKKAVGEKQWIIINKYLGKPGKIFECQNELIDAGFEDYAQL